MEPVLLVTIYAFKVITLDRTHLRDKFSGILLTATMMDGDHERKSILDSIRNECFP